MGVGVGVGGVKKVGRVSAIERGVAANYSKETLENSLTGD